VGTLLNAQQKPFAYWHDAWTHTPQLPSNFTANANAATDDILINATIFYRSPVNFDSILVVAKVGSAPSNRLDGIQLYKGIDTTAIQNDVFTHANFVDQSTVYASIYLRSTDGNWSTAKTDTALFGTPPDNDSLFIVSVTGNNNNSNTITWRSVTSADSYLLYFWTETYAHSYAYGYKGYAELTETTDTVYTHTGLYDGQTVYYVVKYITGSDTSTKSGMKFGYPTRSAGTTYHVAVGGTGTLGESVDPLDPMSVSTFHSNWANYVKGDSILFNRGDVFTGTGATIQPNVSSIPRGTYLNPIVLGAYGTGAKPQIHTDSYTFCGYIAEAHYLTIQDLHFSRGILTFTTSVGDSLVGLRFLRNTVSPTTSTDAKMYCWSSWDEPDSATGSWADGEYQQATWLDWEFGHNIIEGTGTSTEDDGMNFTGATPNLWLYFNKINDVAADGIDAGGGDSMLVEYNQISNTGVHGMKMMGQRASMRWSIWRGNTQAGTTGSDHFGIEIVGTNSNKFYNNTISTISFPAYGGGKPFYGIKQDSVFKANELVNNAFYGYGGKLGGIYFENSVNVTYKYGDTVNNRSFGLNNGRDYVGNNTFMNNLWFTGVGYAGASTGYLYRGHIDAEWTYDGNPSSQYTIDTGDDVFDGLNYSALFSGFSGIHNSNQIIGSRALLIDSTTVSGVSPDAGSPLIYAGLNDQVNYPYWVDANGDSIGTQRSIGAYNETSPFSAISFTTPFAFGSISIDTDTTRTLYIRNTGNLSIVIDSLRLGSSGKFSISESDNQTIDVGDSLAVAITFGLSEEGSWTDSLQIYMTDLADTRAVITGSVTLPQPSAPRTFVATQTGTDEQVNIQAALFDRTPVDFDSIIVIAKAGSYSSSRTDGTVLYYGVDTTAINNDNFNNALLSDAVIYFSCYTLSTSGQWLSSPAQDTATIGTPPLPADIDFEEGDNSDFSSVDFSSTPNFGSIQDSVAYAGTYAMEVLIGASGTLHTADNPIYGVYTITAQGTTTVTGYIWIPASPIGTAYNNMTLIAMGESIGHTQSGHVSVSLRWLDGSDYVWVINDDEFEVDAASSTFSLSGNAWHKIELTYIVHASTGGAVLKINDVEVASNVALNTTGDVINTIIIGCPYGTNPSPSKRWRFDHINVE
jgi:hypothetical protein